MLFFTGCVTKKIWHGNKVNFTENVKQFLVSKDANTIIFLGEKYHFIFTNDLPESTQTYQLVQTLLALDNEERELLTMNTQQSKIFIEKKDNITCDIEIAFNKQHGTNKQIEYFQTLGFKEFNNTTYIKNLVLKGKIYKTDKKFNEYVKDLNNNYAFNLYVDPNERSKLEKIALTPLTISTDLVLTATGVGLGVVAAAYGQPAGIEIAVRTVDVQIREFLDLVNDLKMEIKSTINNTKTIKKGSYKCNFPF